MGGSGTGTAPTCYRHPARETHVACTRCARPICPDCMRSAAVGFQCPECVAEGAATQRRPLTLAGAPLSSGEARLTQGIVGLAVLVFLGQLVVAARNGGDDLLVRDYALQPVAIAAGEPVRLLTAAFLHGGVLHLLFNMYALALTGPALEAVLGRWRYATLYLLSALGGSTTSYALSDERIYGVGASGAVFGLFGAAYVLARRTGSDTRQLTAVLGINLVIGFVPQLGIDWRAHLGGLVVGATIAVVYAYAPRARRTAVQLLALAALTLVLLGVVAARTESLRGLYGLG